MSRVFVTGGAGFIGHHLLRRLIDRNHVVRVIDNLSFGKRDFIPQKNSQLEFVEGDIRDNKFVCGLVEEFQPEIVIHLAAIHFIPHCNSHPVETIETNVMGTRNLLEACGRTKPGLFLFASSAAVYGISDDSLSEDDLVAPTDIYGMSKLAGEDMSRLFHKETGIKTVIARLFNVYGPEETNPHLIPEIVKQLKEGKLEVSLGNTEPKRDFINVNDVVGAFVVLIDKFDGELDVFNVGTGVEHSARELVDIFGKILKKGIKIKGEESRKRESDRMHLLSKISKIKKSLGWQPKISIEDGLREILLHE